MNSWYFFENLTHHLMILRSRRIVVLGSLLVVEGLLVALVMLLLLLLRLLNLVGSMISFSTSSSQSVTW